MIAVDAGVLACAVNRYGPLHARAASLLERLALGERPWAVAWPAAHEFVARVTHAHAVARPLGTAEALGFVASLLASPSAVALGPTERHAEVLLELTADWGRGETAPGLELAAVLREHGVRELLSGDAGMRRYRFLDVIDPLHGPEWSPGQPVRRYRRLTPAARRSG